MPEKMLKNNHSSVNRWAQGALNFMRSLPANNQKTDSTGVKISEAESNKDEDKPFLGTDHKVKFREFELGIYNGPKQEDFINLANSYRKVVEKELSSIENQKLVVEAFEKFETKMKELFNEFPPQLLPADLSKKPYSPEVVKQIAQKIKEGENQLKQVVADFSLILTYDKTKKIIDKKLTKTAKRLRGEVKKDIAKTGRSNSYHIYNIPGDLPIHSIDPGVPDVPGIPSIQRMSSVSTIGEKTIPSSIRDGADAKAPISNFVRRTYGRIETTDGKPSARVEFSGITHSSYPPVDLFAQYFDRIKWKMPNKLWKFARRRLKVPFETEIEIRKRTIAGVEAVLQNLGQKAIAEGEHGNPIEINLTTLSLLTPILKESFERLIRPGVNEAKQLKEVMLALSMCRGRPIDLKDENGNPLKDKDGKPIQIQADISHLNMPVNVGTKIKPYFSVETNTSHQYTIARGFYDYCKNINGFLTLPSDSPPDSNEFNIIKTCLDPFSKGRPEDDPEIPELIATAAGDETLLCSRIDKAYQELYTLQVELQNPNLEAKLATEKKYKELLNKIEGLEKEHKNLCLELIKYHKSEFKRMQVKAEKALEELEGNEKLSPLQANQVATCRLIFDAKKLYLDGEYRKAKNAYKFQARYLLSNDRMGREVEWFCKSAEDRAGRTGENVEELLAFKQKYGKFPSLTDQEKMNETISPSVHDFSVNKQVTDDNDPGARGLQVGNSYNGKHLHLSKIDKPMSLLAKDITDIGKVKPSQWLVEKLSPPLTQAEQLKFLSSTMEEGRKTSSGSEPVANQPTPSEKTIKDEIERWGKFKLLNPKLEALKTGKLSELEKLHANLIKNNDPAEKQKYLAKAGNLINELQGIFPETKPEHSEKEQWRHLGQYKPKSIKKNKKSSSSCKTIEGYLKLSQQSLDSFKKNANQKENEKLYEGVLYKEDKEKTTIGRVDILIPNEGSISRVYNQADAKAEITLSGFSDRAILIALDSSSHFIPLTIEMPRIGGKSAAPGDIVEEDIQFVLKMFVAAKLRGIPIEMDEGYKKIFKEKFPEDYKILNIIKNKDFKNDDIKNKTLGEMVEEIENQNPRRSDVENGPNDRGIIRPHHPN